MRKKYILLKDTPNLKKGAIVEEQCEDRVQEYICITEKSIKFQEGEEWDIIYSQKIVENQPDWFERVEFVEVPIRHIAKVRKFIKSIN